MRLNSKLELFKNSGIDNAIPMTVVQLEEIGITNSRHLTKCLFEKSVNLASQVISKDPTVFIGAYSYMNDGGYLRGKVFIGRYCSIGRRVSIGAGSHPMTGLSTHPSLVYGSGRPYSDIESSALDIKPPRSQLTVIGSDVWIGDGAIITPGISIGTGAVIGANTVVVRDVPPYAIVGGVPAKLIRSRFPQEIASKLLSTEWWEYPVDYVKSLPRSNVYELIETLDRSESKIEFFSDDYDTYKLT